MNSDLTNKVRQAVAKTGYPLELEIAAVARRNGWAPFHAVEYLDAETRVHRELDLLIYKQINERRIELRISCKSSVNKQFVFFNVDRRVYIPFGDLKCTPVVADPERRDVIRDALKGLPIFNEPMLAVNYTVVAGSNPDRDSRALLHDALMSVVASAHHSPLPRQLLFDERGTVYLFIVVLKAPMFAVSVDDSTGESVVTEVSYALWQGKIPIPEHYWQMRIPNSGGREVPFSDALYWFGDRVHVEVLRDTSFEDYLHTVEAAFVALTPAQLKWFGKPWKSEHFPKIVGRAPTLRPRRNRATGRKP
jgi:hypothetical protein